jgi:hypothetical protein
MASTDCNDPHRCENCPTEVAEHITSAEYRPLYHQLLHSDAVRTFDQSNIQLEVLRVLQNHNSRRRGSQAAKR